MRNTLLTTTALVLSAGIASADGHASITWSGAATAGIARAGTAESTAVVARSTAATVTGANVRAWDNANYAAANVAAGATVAAAVPAAVPSSGVFVISAANMKAYREVAAQTLATSLFDYASAASITAANKAFAKRTAELDYVGGRIATTKAKANDFDTYSEVNATVTGSVTAGDITLSASMSVDAGRGYDFANDDGFDGAKTSNVGLDNVTISAGAMGTIKLDENAIAHLVDGDDDGAADLLYTNTIGVASVSFALDLDKDTDGKAATTLTALNSAGAYTVSNAVADSSDVQWSAKVSMPVGTGTAYVAMDEAKGNKFGVSGAFSGMTLSLDSVLEAADSEANKSRSNTLGVGYTFGSIATKATYNTIKDGDQWGVSATYTDAGTSLTVSTDEGSDWSVSGSYELGTGASVVGGVNYTEDAFLGLKFAF